MKTTLAVVLVVAVVMAFILTFPNDFGAAMNPGAPVPVLSTP